MSMIKSKLRPWLRALKKTDLVWRYGLNLDPTISYWKSGQRLSPFQKDLVGELDQNGVAIRTIDEVFENSGSWRELEKGVSDLIADKADDISRLKANADNVSIGDKTFNLECLDSKVTVDPTSVFARTALHPDLLAIANGYLGMLAKMRYYNVWYTAASSSRPRESQLWHYDREDNYILKVFLYLDDVDQGTGPFTYAPGTHRKGKLRSANPEFAIEGGVRRTTDEQMSAVIPESEWIRGTGKKGTIIFADTRGYHKGGEARTRDRLMFTCMYTSPASESQELLYIPTDMDKSTLSRYQLGALGYR